MLIDLTKELDTEHRRLIDSLMFNGDFLRANYPYQYQNQQVSFSHSILKVASRPHSWSVTYLVLDTHILGQGDFATVHDILWVLTPHFNGFKRASANLVVKIQKTNDMSFERLYQEYLAFRSIPHLGITPPIQSGFHLFTVMNKIDGMTLKSYMAHGLSETEQELLISRIKQAYLTQVEQHGLSHNDIHDENILVNPDSGLVFFIDYSNPDPRNSQNQKKDERQLETLFSRIKQAQEQPACGLH